MKINKRSECPVSFCLDFFGDKWALLIIRDLALNDKSTFRDFLSSDEHIATNILTDRLKMLEGGGFVLKYPVSGKSRTAYCLTERGISLVPVVIEMAMWGAQQGINGYRKELGEALQHDKQGVISQLEDVLKTRLKSAGESFLEKPKR